MPDITALSATSALITAPEAICSAVILPLAIANCPTLPEAMLPDTTDLHGDFTSAEEVRKAMESFNKSAMRANLFHRVMTDTFEVIESYLAPTNFVLGEVPVKKGTWLMTLQVYDEELWKMVKSGDINGISIGAMAQVEKLDEED